MKLTSLLFIFLILVSCKSKVPSKISNQIEISTFSEIPEEIKDCGSVFSESNSKLNNRKYIFVAGYDSIAFLSIDSKLQKLKVKKYIHKPNTPNNEDSINEFYNDDLKVIVYTYIDWEKVKKERVDGWWIKGYLILERKNGEKISKRFVGKSGCKIKSN